MVCKRYIQIILNMRILQWVHDPAWKHIFRILVLIALLAVFATLYTNRPCKLNRIRLFENIQFNDSEELTNLLQFNDLVTHSKFHQNEVPVIVTAASSNHFIESIILLENINRHLRPKYPDIKIIYFNIGLQADEKNVLKRHCNVQVRDFPFSLFSSHIQKLETYSWKPIIISLILKEFNFVMWVDTSIRFNMNLPIEKLFRKARLIGIQTLNGEGSIAERTSIDTMHFLQQNPKDFQNIPELQTGWSVFSRTYFTTEYIIRPWIQCTFTQRCIFPDSVKRLPHDCVRTNQTDSFGYCHRPEQSVFGIILSLIFTDRRDCVSFEGSTYGHLSRRN